MNWTNTFKEVFVKRKYLLTTIVIAIIFYSFNIIISSWRGFTEFSSNNFFSKIKLFFFLFVKFGGTIKIYSFISIILISALIGVLFSLVLYKVKMNMKTKNKTGALGVVGVFLAIFVPGCSVCGVGLISVLGLGAGLISFLPFRGFELSILAIFLLGFSILKITKDMYKCKVSLNP